MPDDGWMRFCRAYHGERIPTTGLTVGELQAAMCGEESGSVGARQVETARSSKFGERFRAAARV